MDNLSDNELMMLAKNGSEEAFAIVVDRHKVGITGFIFRMLGNQEDAVDLAQESFVRVFIAIGRYRDDHAFSTYLYRIASNLAISELRKRKRRRLVSLTWLRGGDDSNDEYDAPIASDDAGPENDVIDEERRRIIEKAILSLPEKYRAPVILRDINDLSYEEIAEALGLGIGTTKSRISRGRGILREKLAEYITVSADGKEN
jgi:RNA polymerase sigma-70 factor (ECF subfamily)